MQRTHGFFWIGASLLAGAISLGGCGDDSACSTACGSGGSGAGGGVTSTGGGGAGTTSTGGGDAGGGGGGGGIPTEWVVPTCTTVTGTAAVSFTKDEGATIAPTEGTLSGVAHTGVAALDTPNTLLAEHKGDLLRSTDAGCTWAKIGTLTGGSFNLTAAPGGRAYAWVDNYPSIYRIDADGTATQLTTPGANIVGVGVDPSDGLHLRIGDASGAISDSIDGGANWTKGGLAPLGNLSIGYRFAFDPADLDHVLFGQSGDGAHVSFDGGATWTSSFGLGKSGANAFSLAVSPADPLVVWAEALEVGPNVRHVYRSGDGGETFDIVLTESAEVDLINGNLLAPHPTDADVLYFIYGSSYQAYGTDLFRYDHGAAAVTVEHNAYDEISAIAPSPADPSVLYLGFVIDGGG